MSIILQGFGSHGGLITQGYDIAADAIYPPANAVAAGVIFGPNGSRVGTLTYAGFAATGDAPSQPVDKRRATPARILDKRTADIRLYDIDLTYLLNEGEQILYVRSIRSDQGNLGFGEARINPAPIYYRLLDMTCDIGKVVQVQLRGGDFPYGVGELLCTCRMIVATTENEALEATFIVRLTNEAP